MPQKEIVIRISGEEAHVLGALDAFCKYHGWTVSSQQTQEQYARERIRAFLADSVRAHSSAEAERAAREAARVAAEAAIMQTTMTLRIEEIEP